MRLAIALVIAAPAGVLASAQPRTPWGDPDLPGTYTNTYENGTPLERPECHEGNYGLRNILSAARAEERERAR